MDDPKPEEIFTVGTLANIVQSVKLAGRQHSRAGGRRGARQGRAGRQRRRFLPRHAETGSRQAEPSPQIEQAVRRVNGLFEQYVKLSQSLNYDTMIAAARVDDPAKLSDTIAANLQIPVEEKQELLENFDRARPLESRRAKFWKAKSKNSTSTATSIPA